MEFTVQWLGLLLSLEAKVLNLGNFVSKPQNKIRP